MASAENSGENPMKMDEEEFSVKSETIETAKPGVTITIRAPTTSEAKTSLQNDAVAKTSPQNVVVAKTEFSNVDSLEEDDDENGSPGQNLISFYSIFNRHERILETT